MNSTICDHNNYNSVIHFLQCNVSYLLYSQINVCIKSSYNHPFAQLVSLEQAPLPWPTAHIWQSKQMYITGLRVQNYIAGNRRSRHKLLCGTDIQSLHL